MNWFDKIKDHYSVIWGLEAEACPFSAGPIHQLPKEFSVLKFPPHGERRFWTYATCGMSDPNDAYPLELHIFSPVDSLEVVEILIVTAHYHRNGSRLGLGHSVNFGRPWIAGSTCQFGLISLPYLDGPDLEDFEMENLCIKFYWLIPITASEVEFKKVKGLGALEDKFESAALDYLNPLRESVV